VNSNHRVNVIRIDAIHPHTNADTLGLVFIGGYQCVVKKDDYKVGDLAVYVQPDSIVPQTEPFKFLWADREFTGDVPVKYRRVTVRRFRKEYSEGLLMPLAEFPQLIGIAGEGDDVAELLGVTHYVEPEPGMSTENPKRKLTLWQRILKFFGLGPKPFGPKLQIPVFDVESLKNYPRALVEGEPVLLTEKIHGSNARYVFDGKRFWVGSHKTWRKHDNTNIWSRVALKFPWIEAFCRAWPGFTLYGEVTPTQPGFAYGFATEEQFFAIDVRRPDGTWIDKKTLYKLSEIQRFVPVIYEGPYSSSLTHTWAEGNSLVEGAKNIREGVVVSAMEERVVRGVGRAQLKLKSLTFLEKEGKGK
jgi:RNA ligase (TIGR02306 family)